MRLYGRVDYRHDPISGGSGGRSVNEYLERLDPEELQKVQQKQVYGLKRSKAFYDAEFQKNWQGDITHACSRDAAAMKNYYLAVQISDMMKQLYKWSYLRRKRDKETAKRYIFRPAEKLWMAADRGKYINGR